MTVVSAMTFFPQNEKDDSNKILHQTLKCISVNQTHHNKEFHNVRRKRRWSKQSPQVRAMDSGAWVGPQR